MISFRWVTFLLRGLLAWSRSFPLVRPDRIEGSPSFLPRILPVQGLEVFYTMKGRGEPLLLIHGYGAGLWVWEKQMEALSQRFQIYAFDLIGHGYSDRPRVAYTPMTYLLFTKNLMDTLGLEKATLIGNSMGGGIAWAMALFWPERVRNLILIDAVPPNVLEEVRSASFRSLVTLRRFPLLPYLILATRNRHSILAVLRECVYEKSLITPQVLERQYRISKIKGSTWPLYSTLMNAEKASSLRGRLSEIHQPTLILWGSEDLILPLSVGEALQAAIPRSRFHVIEKSGHIPMWEKPGEVNQAILSFLSESL